MRAILTYHSIDSSGSPVSVDAAAFARHVDFLAAGRVAVLPLVELLASPPARDAVAITFDDGFENLASVAWPRLRERGLPATLFVVTDRAGGDNAWGGYDEPGIPRLPLLGWDALGALADEGLELGAHSRTHPHLESLDDARQEDEIAGSAAELERRTGRRPETFCYPYGTFDERAVRRAATSYRAACTTELAALPAAPDPHRLPRLDAYYYRAPGRLEAWGTPAFHAHLWLRRQARRARALLR